MIVNLKDITTETIQSIKPAEKNIRADVFRLDKIHDVISGNKWFKLKYYLQEASEKGYKNILTFGGAYSNHIVATACAANNINMNSVGIIRVEMPVALSHTLTEAKNYGMHLEFINRNEYKKNNESGFLNELRKKFPDHFIIPEGGLGTNGVKGSSEILNYANVEGYTHILCAVGTGTMFAGIANAIQPAQKLTGICVLKGLDNMKEDLNKFIGNPKKNFDINHDYHFGGYAKKTNELIDFMNHFHAQTKIPSDFVYTGKLFYSVTDLIKRNHFASGSKLLIIHSGGLQGNKSLKPGTVIF